MLQKIVIGWEDIEDVFLANLAIKKPFILMGRHGICKTTVAREIAKIYKNHDDSHFRFYDATKDDLISIAGIPMPEELKKGRLTFSEHDRSIWKANIIVVDEISRANKENQNLWLEIIEEHTCFGKKLIWEQFIATMNPDTYASTFKLDEALIDRFYAIIPVPDFQKARASQLEEVIRLNFNNHSNGENEIIAIRENLIAIEGTYKELRDTEQFFSGVTEFVATFFEALLSQRQFAQEIYLSPRKAIQVTAEILAITAARMVLKNQELNKILTEKAALKALIYTICIPLQLPEDKIRELFEQLKPTLFKFNLSPTDKIRLELGKLDQSEVYQFFLENNTEIQKHLEKDEVEKLIGELSQSEAIKKSEILNFYGAVSEMNGLEEWKRKIFGVIIKNVHNQLESFCINLRSLEIVDGKGVKLFASIQKFLDSFKTIPFPQANTEFLLDNNFSGSGAILKAIKNFVTLQETQNGTPIV